MNTLREAIQDYIDMRRSLGYKMNDQSRQLLGIRDVHGTATGTIHHS